MSVESVPLALPPARLATHTCEATILYRELRKPLLRYLVCVGLTADEAQDVVQDAFVSLHCHVAAGGSQENIRSWLFRVAHNAARNRQNSGQQRFSVPLDAKVEASVIDEATPERAVLEKKGSGGCTAPCACSPTPSASACCSAPVVYLFEKPDDAWSRLAQVPVFVAQHFLVFQGLHKRFASRIGESRQPHVITTLPIATSRSPIPFIRGKASALGWCPTGTTGARTEFTSTMPKGGGPRFRPPGQRCCRKIRL